MTDHIAWLQAQLRDYIEDVAARDVSPATKSTYMQQADRFVRWVASR